MRRASSGFVLSLLYLALVACVAELDATGPDDSVGDLGKADDASDDSIVVALNFSDDRNGLQNVTVPLTRPGLWIDTLVGDTLDVPGSSIDIDFGYSEGKIFINTAHTQDSDD